MRSAAELKVLRAGTKAFIKSNVSCITLIPRTRIKSGTGVAFQDQPARLVQEFRLLDQSTSRNTWPGMVRTSDGVERLVDYVLLAEYDAEIAAWDYWVTDEGTFEVVEVYPDNGYERRASVVRRA